MEEYKPPLPELEGPFFKVDLSPAEIVEIAVWLEKTAVEFYRMLADQIEPGPLRDFFLGLTGMEIGHEKKMRGLLLLLAGEPPGKVAFDETLTGREYFVHLRALAMKKVFPEGFEVFTMLDSFTAPRDAVAMALELEKKSIKLYGFLALFRLAPEAQAVVESMIEEEKKHLAEVTKIYLRFQKE